jgi:cytochrome c-type biogenesis protein CcmH
VTPLRSLHRATLLSVLAVGVLAAVLALSGPACAGAQTTPAPGIEGAPQGPPLSGAELDRATEETASLMRCPVCQGLSVADSPASSAVDLKAEVRRLLALGYTRDQVIASFERSYGEFIRLEPKAEGFNWLVWLMPMLALAVGALVIFFRLRPARRAPETSPTQEETPSS